MKSGTGKKWVSFSLMLALAVGQTAGIAAAETPKTLWEHTYGGADRDSGSYAVATSDKGIAAIGAISTGDQMDLAIVKTDANGEKAWEKTYRHGIMSDGRVLQQTADSGYIAVGSTFESYEKPGELYLLKTDKDGGKTWEKTFGAAKGGAWGNGVTATADGGYIAVGGTNGGYVLAVKTSADGTVVWEKELGKKGGWADRIYPADGGFIVVGNINPDGKNKDIYLLKISGAGEVLWEQTIGGAGSEWANDVASAKDGGYVIVGNTNSKGAGDNDIYLVKTDGKGKVLWEKTFGGAKNDWGRGVEATWDGGFVAVGVSGSDQDPYSWGENGKIHVVKTDANGTKLWETTIAGTGRTSGQDILQTADGGFVVTGLQGANEGDMYVAKLSGDGSSPAKEPAKEPDKAVAKTVKQVSADVAKLSLAKSKTKQIKLTAVYTDGSKADVTSQAAWSTTKASVATVSKSGLVTAKGKGTAVVKGVFGGKTVSVTVTVK